MHRIPGEMQTYRLPHTPESAFCRWYGRILGRWRGRSSRPVLIVGNSFTAALCAWIQKTGRKVRIMNAGEWVNLPRRQRYRMMSGYSHVIFTCLKYNGSFFRSALLRGCIPVALFLGSDVLTTGRVPKRLAAARRAGRLGIMLAVSPWLVEELAALRIPASHFPFIARPVKAGNVPMPASFTVLSYIQKDKEQLYGYQHIRRLAGELPGVIFKIAGHDGEGLTAAGNITFLGYVDDMAGCIDSCSVYIRMTRHDGMPNMVVEALARGRQVIWSGRFDHCIHADTYGRLKDEVLKLNAGCPFNAAGAAYAEDRFGPGVIMHEFEKLLN